MLSLTYTALWSVLVCLVWRKGQFFDQFFLTTIKKFCERRLDPLQEELLLLQALSLGLKSGRSLDEVLSEQARNTLLPLRLQKQTQLIALGKDMSLLGRLLQNSLANGSPCAVLLQNLREQNTRALKAKRRKNALLLQAQAQAWTIALVPWVLLALFLGLDNNFAAILLANGSSYLYWLCALALDIAAILWLRRLSKRCLEVSGDLALCGKELLPLLQELRLALAGGNDLEDSLRAAARYVGPKLRRLFLSEGEPIGEFPREALIARQLIQQAVQFGSPIAQELNALVADLEQQQETTWESALQLLPLRSLAPLFLCAFPATLLVLCSVLSPLLGSL